MKIGITGGIGSGKTTVCRLFEMLGASIYYSDFEAKFLMSNDAELVDGLKALFHPEDPFENGQLRRSFIAEKIFNDKQLLSQINNLVHPAVRSAYINRIDNHEGSYLINEAALLTNHNDEFDILILVKADQKDQVDRVVQRDQAQVKEVEARMRYQLPDDQRGRVDFVIENKKGLSLIDQVYQVHQSIISQSK